MTFTAIVAKPNVPARGTRSLGKPDVIVAIVGPIDDRLRLAQHTHRGLGDFDP
jgi:hypothetical protein